ncbi:MAG: TlpA family protein disulfide reductase [Paracoccaceae bacterium]|nr:TlpA family protein disulfide reductase [Paracoccaceae bacterium]
MRHLRSAVLYAALALGANAALADAATVDTTALKALATGSMEKLSFTSRPMALPDLAVLDAAGTEHHLSDYRGKYVVLNFWATWCAPCRKEMPALDRLQAELGGDRLAVVPVGSLRTTAASAQKFFDRENVTHLPVLIDPDARMARALGIMGLPMTLILDPEGREIARLIGEADWDSPSAKAILSKLISG